MCFTPKISIITATLEFIAAFYIFLKFRKNEASHLLATFVALLGLYQFSEFMLCTSQNPNFWGSFGFISYTFLPALGIHFILKYANPKLTKLIYLIYLPAIIFSFLAIFTNNFIVQGTCSTVFIILKTAFTQLDSHFWTTLIYFFYYFSYVTIVTIILIMKSAYEKNIIRKKIYLLILFADIFSLFPALILIVALPSLNMMFPSIYCQFALLYAILAVVTLHLNNKYLKQ